MNIRARVFFAAIAIAAGTASANVYLKGKPAHGASTADCPVDVMRIMWGSNETKSGDRIQGQIMLSKESPRQGHIKIIIQSVDSSGNPLEAYALSTDYDTRFGRWYYEEDYYDDSFCYGFTHMKLKDEFREYTRYHKVSQKIDPGWFYFDFEKPPHVKDFLIVNVVLDGNEVHHNLRLVGNRLMRTMSALPKIKRGHKGDFSETVEWVPPQANPADDKPEKKTDVPKPIKKEKEKELSLIEKHGESEGETLFSANINWSWSSKGADFSFVPSVKIDGSSASMSVLLTGNAVASTGYSPRLSKILLFDPNTKELLELDKQNTTSWPRFYLTTKRGECRLELPSAAVAFFAGANDIRGRLSFEHSDSAAGRNFDYTFTKEQVSALRKLAEKCLESQAETSN
jgi:hypothetical protein